MTNIGSNMSKRQLAHLGFVIIVINDIRYLCIPSAFMFWADTYCVVVIGSSERGPIAIADVIFPSLFPSWSILVVDKNLLASFDVSESNVLIPHHTARDGLRSGRLWNR
jgi:hypothetical protein